MASLGEDLAQLRKKENLTIQDIYDVTRLPASIIKSIENESIFNDPTKNSTYVRSFVRTYARALKISENDIVTALDQKFDGKYDGLIKNRYHGLTSTELPSEEEVAPEDADKSYQPRFSLADSEEKAKQEDNQENDIKKKERDKTDTPSSKAKTTAGDIGNASKETPPENPVEAGNPNQEHVPPPPNIKNVDWARMSAKTVDPPAKPHTIVISSIIIILVLLLGYFIYNYGRNPFSSVKKPSFATTTDSSTQLANVIPEDSLKSANQAAKPAPVITNTFPDTIKIDIYAAVDKLDPVRVKTDILDSLNPYWIEKGQAMRFGFLKDIYIRGQFSRMMLLINGHPITDFIRYRDPDGLVHITRAILENDPKWLSTPPDTLGNGIPKPAKIIDRPRFY